MSNPNNTIQLIGRLTADPELRTTTSGKQVCGMRLAVDGLGGKDTAGYIDLSCWNAPGQACARTLTKGWKVAVSGELQISPWERDGRKGLNISIPFATVEFLTAPRATSQDLAPVAEGEPVF